MAEQIIDPLDYEAKGTIPRKAVVGFVVAVSAIALGTYVVTSDAEPVKTAEEAVQAELEKPGAVLSQAKGNPARVDEAAQAAADRFNRLKPPLPDGQSTPDAQIPGAAPLPTLNQGGAKATTVALTPAAEPAKETRAGGKKNPDPAEMARELEARDGGLGPAFDESGPGSPSTSGGGSPLGAFEDKFQSLSRQVSQLGLGGEPGGGTQDPVLNALSKVAGPQSAKSSGEAFQERVSNAQPLAALHPVPAAGGLVVNQGKVIPAVITRHIKSDMMGTVTAKVSMNVYDSRTQKHLVLPMGADLVGVYNNQVSLQQERMQFAFTRLIMPDGSSYNLPGASASDLAGAGGVPGDVNRHLLRIFGSSILLGALADRVTKPSALPNGGAYGQGGGLSATGQVFVDTARTELERNKDIAPTIDIHVGTRINVEVVSDIVFPAEFQVGGGS